MTKEIMKIKLKDYALAIAKLVLRLPFNFVNKNYADQLSLQDRHLLLQQIIGLH